MAKIAGYLEQRRMEFSAVVDVPTTLRDVVGSKRLKKGLGTRDNVVAVLIFVLLAPFPASATDGLYRCTAKSVLATQDDGTFGPFANNVWTEHWSNVLIDTATGVVRRGAQQPERWAVIQRGSKVNDFVAAPYATLGSASKDVLRVRAWSDKPTATFLYYGLSMVVTGTCASVQ